MPSISFSMFKEKLLDGTKTQAIKRHGKKPRKVGDTLYIFWKQREKVGTGKVTDLFDIKISEEGIIMNDQFYDKDSKELNDLANREGFGSGIELLNWFDSMYELSSNQNFQVIRWEWLGCDFCENRITDKNYHILEEKDGVILRILCSNCK